METVGSVWQSDWSLSLLVAWRLSLRLTNTASSVPAPRTLTVSGGQGPRRRLQRATFAPSGQPAVHSSALDWYGLSFPFAVCVCGAEEVCVFTMHSETAKHKLHATLCAMILVS